MAKRTRKERGLEPKFQPRTEQYITSDGIWVILKGMPPLQITRISEEVEFPEKPTYTAELAGGGEEVHPHEVNVEKKINTLKTDEDRKAWAEYVILNDLAEEHLTMLTLKAILADGVDVQFEDGQLERWVTKQTYIGMKIPDDQYLQELLYKETEVVGGTEDMEYIMAAVMRLTGVSEEQMAEARDSFQDSVESATSGGNGEAS